MEISSKIKHVAMISTHAMAEVIYSPIKSVLSGTTFLAWLRLSISSKTNSNLINHSKNQSMKISEFDNAIVYINSYRDRSSNFL